MKNTFLMVFTLIYSFLSAQTKSIDETDETIIYEQLDSLDSLILARPYCQIGVSYDSKLAYNGRTEGVEQYSIAPSASVHFGKGWLLEYEGGIWSASTPQYAFSSVGLSKTFDVGSAEMTLGYSRWFFNYGTSTDRSDYNGEIDIALNWSLGDFTIGSSNSLLFGNGRALFLQPAISWETSNRFGKNGAFKWSFNPSLAVDIGNDVSTRIVKLRPNRPGKTVGKTIFAVLNYGIILPISLSFGGSELSLAYHFYAPKNIETPNSSSPFGVFAVGFNHRFSFH